MVKNHLKTITAPKTWIIKRKNQTFVTRPAPGPHKLEYCMSLSLVLRELIKFAQTSKEAKQIIKTKDVFVDKRKRSNERFGIGFMDVIEFPQIEDQYRILLDNKGRLNAVKATIKESGFKLSRIQSKTKISGGKTQLNMSDGRNLIVDKDAYKTGDSLQLTLPDQKITEHFKLEKGAQVMLVGGKHSGKIATLEEMNNNMILIKAGSQKLEALKKHAFVIGKDKPVFDSLKQLTK